VIASIELTQANLARIRAARQVITPGYDRALTRVGIVHFGVGGFHRSHQAMYLDRLLSLGRDRDWGICGVGLLPADRARAGALRRQDCLYTLLAKHDDGTPEARIIGSLVECLYAPDEPQKVMARLTAPTTRIVSLTITEGGYNVDQATGTFDTTDALVTADAANPAAPQTVFGYVVEALRLRRAAGIAPFTVLSCDNLPGNGNVARTAFAAFANMRDPGLAAWISASVAFPNSMVDRITPVTTPDHAAEVRERFGVDDRCPVVCEPFTQWVIEENFPSGRPFWERAGVQMVPDVHPYELMKLRLLNVSHQALAYPGYLCGYRHADEAVRDPLFERFLLGYMEYEAGPTLPPVPGIDLSWYRHSVIRRFANSAIGDTIARLCTDTSDRIPKWMVPVVRHNVQSGGEVRRSATVIAAWTQYALGADEQGRHISVIDKRSHLTKALAQESLAQPMAFIECPSLFGTLALETAFADAYIDALTFFRKSGARATLERITADLPAPSSPGPISSLIT
jgi:mannitol 2-dehydrogenase